MLSVPLVSTFQKTFFHTVFRLVFFVPVHPYVAAGTDQIYQALLGDIRTDDFQSV